MHYKKINQNRGIALVAILAATEHAKAQIFDDSITTPNMDTTLEPWNINFSTSSKDPKKAVNINESQEDQYSKWFYVCDKEGLVIGRYAVSIEDEAGKINANAASSINSKTQNQGIETSEIILSDEKSRGIPFSTKTAKKSLLIVTAVIKNPVRLMRMIMPIM